MLLITEHSYCSEQFIRPLYGKPTLIFSPTRIQTSPASYTLIGQHYHAVQWACCLEGRTGSRTDTPRETRWNCKRISGIRVEEKQRTGLNVYCT